MANRLKSKKAKVTRLFGQKPLIYLISDGAATAENYREKSLQILELVKKAVAAEISIIQIREKQLSAKLVFELAAEIARLTKNSKTKLLVSDRADIALAAGADGVHLTSGSLSAKIVRAVFPSDLLIGVSAHTLTETQTAKSSGADFAVFSPIFATASKAKYGAPQGIEKLREVTEKVGDFPVIALGGIDQNNFSKALNAGAVGIAAIRFLNAAEKLNGIVDTIRNYKNE